MLAFSLIGFTGLVCRGYRGVAKHNTKIHVGRLMNQMGWKIGMIVQHIAAHQLKVLGCFGVDQLGQLQGTRLQSNLHATIACAFPPFSVLCTKFLEKQKKYSRIAMFCIPTLASSFVHA